MDIFTEKVASGELAWPQVGGCQYISNSMQLNSISASFTTEFGGYN